MKIYAPVENVNGVYASVRFVNSVGETNNPALIHWFKTHGYRVEDTKRINDEAQLNQILENDEITITDEVITEDRAVKNGDSDLDNMNPNELREWMKSNGYGSQIKNIRNKEKLLNIIRG